MYNKQVIVGNWKMNGNLVLVRNFLNELQSEDAKFKRDVVICPPHVYIHPMTSENKSEAKFGAQNISSFAKEGAYTGEICAQMLLDVKCEYVIIGHSERVKYFSEAGNILKEKIIAAHNAGLIAIICVGETEENRESGTYLEFLAECITSYIPESANLQNTIIAYEPVWAIGTGMTPTNDQIQEVIELIQGCMQKKMGNQELTIENSFRILYGGSVTSSNASSILSIPGLSGALVGSASLDFSEFFKIVNA